MSFGTPLGTPAPADWTPVGMQRRTHPISPVVSSARVFPFVGFALVAWGPDLGAGLLLLLAGAVGLVLISSGLSYLSWQRFVFWFDAEGDFRVDKGVLTRTQSRLQLSRLQSVDVVQPLLARLVGLAEVRVEVAGAGESRATLSYLSLAQANALRSEVLGRAAGVRPDAGEAPENVLHVVPTPLLIKSLLMRGATFALLVLSAVIVVTTVATEGTAGWPSSLPAVFRSLRCSPSSPASSTSRWRRRRTGYVPAADCFRRARRRFPLGAFMPWPSWNRSCGDGLVGCAWW